MVVCEALVSLRARRVRAGRGVLQLQASDGDRPGGLFMISPELQPTHAAKKKKICEFNGWFMWDTRSAPNQGGTPRGATHPPNTAYKCPNRT